MPDLFAERYEIVSIIGTGGVGTVYKVFDPLLNKYFAVKVLKQNSDESKAARLQREAKSAGKLNHPHICRIDNFGQTSDGSPYMVMEFLEGEDLSNLLQREGALSLERALEIAIQVASALAYAHQHGVIHRDLKPANVLLLNASQTFIKLLDFGVAKDESKSGDITQIGAIVGSPLYMSPEQIKGEEISVASDIYSFGCMLFEILTGEPPFKADSIVETFSMHKMKEAPKLASIDSFPLELSELVERCLKKNALDRPLSFNEVLSQLENIQRSLLSQNQSPDVLNEQTDLLEQEKSRRKRSILVLSASTVLFFLVIAVAFIGKDIANRQVLPETKISDQSGLNHAANAFFDPDGDRTSLFISDSKLGDLGKRATPSVVDEDLKLLQNQKIIKLSFDGSQVNGSGLKYVVNCGIVQLRMQNCEILDENMKYIAQMKELSNLSLYSHLLTDKGLAYIGDARKFNSLELHSDKITNQGLARIKHLDHCTHLSFRGKNLTIDCIKSIGKSKNLQTLEIGKFKVEGDLGTLLVAFPQLHRIDFADIESISPSSLRSLEKKRLDSISILRSNIGFAQMKAISELKELKTLCLFKCVLDIEGLKFLEHSTALTYLHLTENQNISGKGVVYLSKVKHLQLLNLSKTNLKEDDLAVLLSMPDLNLIDVRDCISLPKEAIEKFSVDYKARWGRNLQVNS